MSLVNGYGDPLTSHPPNTPQGVPVRGYVDVMSHRSAILLTMSSKRSNRRADLVCLWPDEGTGPWLAEIELREIGGRAECVGLRIEWAGDPRHLRALTTSDLRRLRLAEMIAGGRKGHREVDVTAFVDHLRESGIITRAEPPPAGPSAGSQGGRPILYGDDHYEEVAQVYRRAFAEGQPPRRAVAEWFNVSPSAASKWVAEARKRGTLPPTERGVARADGEEKD